MTEKISGVSIEVSVDYQLLKIEEDGHLGRLKTGSRAIIRIIVSPEYSDSTHAFIVQGWRKKQVVPKKDLARAQKEKIYMLKIPIEESRSRLVACTMPNTNNMQLIQLSPDGGFQMWKIVLISQGGDFFLVVQKTYKSYCYRDGDGVACPIFETRFGARKDWPSMVKFLNSLLGDKIEKLNPAEKYEPKPEIATDELEPDTGKVLFWDPSKGIGAISTSEEVVSAYWKEVPGRPRLRYLVPGEIVQIEKLGPHPQNPERPSEFERRAIGIKPIS